MRRRFQAPRSWQPDAVRQGSAAGISSSTLQTIPKLNPIKRVTPIQLLADPINLAVVQCGGVVRPTDMARNDTSIRIRNGLSIG